MSRAETITASHTERVHQNSGEAATSGLGWGVGLAVLHAILAGGAFLVLAAVFGFPDILREPAAVSLAKFAENPATIRAAYYAFTLSSLLIIPLALIVRRALDRDGSLLLGVATAFGVLSGLTQILGFSRWTILVPYLAETYVDPASSQTTREAIVVAYEVFNRYAGMTLGEHFGWVFQGGWVLLLAVAIIRSRVLPRWVGPSGIVIAALILISTLEQFRFGFEAPLELANTIGTTAFPFWLIALTISLWRARSR